jgi:hypothetical protein
MSTSGAIFRKNIDGSLEGRYHHFDSYPEGLGKALHGIYKSEFSQNLSEMMKILIDEHPAGWSTICKSSSMKTAICYCHMMSKEPGSAAFVSVSDAFDCSAEYCYIIDPAKKTMEIVDYYGKRNLIHMDWEIEWKKVFSMPMYVEPKEEIKKERAYGHPDIEI